jgi:hypothetical protein
MCSLDRICSLDGVYVMCSLHRYASAASYVAFLANVGRRRTSVPFFFLPYTDSYHVDVLVYHWLTTLACLDKAGVHDRLRISEEALIGPINSLYLHLFICLFDC